MNKVRSKYYNSRRKNTNNRDYRKNYKIQSIKENIRTPEARSKDISPMQYDIEHGIWR